MLFGPAEVPFRMNRKYGHDQPIAIPVGSGRAVLTQRMIGPKSRR